MTQLDEDGPGPAQSTALIPYQRMDTWEQLMLRHGDVREGALESQVRSCPLQKEWAITVQVVSEEPGHWPVEMVVFGVDFETSADEAMMAKMSSELSTDLYIDGRGPDRGRIQCDARGWVAAATPLITLPDDNDKTFQVKIRRLRWIALRVRYHDRDVVVPGVTIKMTLPDAVAPHQRTTDDATVRVGEDKLVRAAPVAVTEMALDQGVWEHVPA